MYLKAFEKRKYEKLMLKAISTECTEATRLCKKNGENSLNTKLIGMCSVIAYSSKTSGKLIERKRHYL